MGSEYKVSGIEFPDNLKDTGASRPGNMTILFYI